MILILFSALSFIFYALRSFFSSVMFMEYKRWGLSELRVVISCLQIFGSIGLIAGIFINNLLIICSFFFVIMMIVALYFRYKVKDGFLASVPAIIYIIVNAIIFIEAIST